MSILVSSIVITGGLVLSSITVNAATVKNGWAKATATTWCYYNKGKLVKNSWLSINSQKYYIDNTGAIISNKWYQVAGKWYYLRPDGTLAKDITPSHVTVGKFECAYSSIQDAINNVPNCAITLVIQPGTYYEHITSIGKNISMQGTNKTTCIVRDDSGNYFNAPLTISGNGNISNLTFISTHDKSNYGVPSYAMHSDSNGSGTLTFTNCNFTSYQNSAVGIGMHQSQTIIFDSCQFTKDASFDASHNSGAFYCHNAVASNTTNQHLIIKNSQMTTNLGIVMRIDDANTIYGGKNSQMDIGLYNNTLTSAERGKSNIINVYNDPINVGVCGQIRLVKDSSINGITFAKFIK
jgi:hypothetical protein